MPQGFAFTASQVAGQVSSADLNSRLTAIEPAEGVAWGTTMPTSPYEFQRFGRTDLGEIFYWDASRSLWLSVIQRQCWLTQNSNLTQLKNGDTIFNNANQSGLIWPYDVVLLRYFGNSRQSQTETGTLTLYNNGVTIDTITVSGANTWDSGDKSLAISSGELLAAGIVGSSTGNWQRVSILLEIARTTT